jgi:hypothetical protein
MGCFEIIRHFFIKYISVIIIIINAINRGNIESITLFVIIIITNSRMNAIKKNVHTILGSIFSSNLVYGLSSSFSKISLIEFRSNAS